MKKGSILSLPFIYSLGVSNPAIHEGRPVSITSDPVRVVGGNSTVAAMTQVLELTLLLSSRATVGVVDFHQSTKCNVMHWFSPEVVGF